VPASIEKFDLRIVSVSPPNVIPHRVRFYASRVRCYAAGSLLSGIKESR
jgi:hypothetical protein